MARPSKAAVARSGHATKEEIEQREAAEKSLLTGLPLLEQPKVAADKTAHAEFLRVVSILEKIGKNDALYENVINRYCVLRAECEKFEKMRERWEKNLAKLEKDRTMDPETSYRLQAQMQKSILDTDNRVQAKRKAMFDIEKECAMTVSSALRSIPKSAAAPKNPLEGLIGGD